MLKIKITLGSLVDNTYIVARTTAPKDYDGFGTISLGESYLHDRKARVVLIQENHLEWHAGRYGSGLHSIDTEETADVIDERDIIELLYKRLQQQTPDRGNAPATTPYGGCP